jgi:hypothetical protein
MDACEQCGAPLPLRRKLKTFCSYACRGQHNALAELNKIASAEVHRAWMMQGRKQWPRDLVGAESRPGSMQIDGKLRDAILGSELLAMPSHAEPLSGAGFQLEFYDGGCPKLPECLRRTKGHEGSE